MAPTGTSTFELSALNKVPAADANEARQAACVHIVLLHAVRGKHPALSALACVVPEHTLVPCAVLAYDTHFLCLISARMGVVCVSCTFPEFQVPCSLHLLCLLPCLM